MQGQPASTVPAPGYTLIDTSSPSGFGLEIGNNPEVYRNSPSFCWAETTGQRLMQDGYRPPHTTRARQNSRDWYTDSIWYACKSIIRSVKGIRDLVVYSAGAAIAQGVLEAVIHELFEALEVGGSVGFHYMTHFFEISRQLRNPSVSPYYTRREELLKSLERLRQYAAESQDQARIKFTRDWTFAVWEDLKEKTSANPDLLHALESWLRIHDGLYRFSVDPLLASSQASLIFFFSCATWFKPILLITIRTRPFENLVQPGGPEPWRLLKYREIKAIVDTLIVETPPAYSESSLRHESRIGLRQSALRPDLKVLGLARDGGYLF
ncbi:hypothetical protein JCM16303_003293 [Sporobolomyces ruberrimus]